MICWAWGFQLVMVWDAHQSEMYSCIFSSLSRFSILIVQIIGRFYFSFCPIVKIVETFSFSRICRFDYFSQVVALHSHRRHMLHFVNCINSCGSSFYFVVDGLATLRRRDKISSVSLFNFECGIISFLFLSVRQIQCSQLGTVQAIPLAFQVTRTMLQVVLRAFLFQPRRGQPMLRPEVQHFTAPELLATLVHAQLPQGSLQEDALVVRSRTAAKG